jgi:protein-tyrosine phosphatase
MELHPNRHLPITGTFNVRDLGGYSAGDAETLWRRILRADGLHRLDEDGRDALVALGIKTVIDLRRPQELKQQPNPLDTDERVRYINISLFENLAPNFGLQDATLSELYYRAIEERREAIGQVLSLIADADEGAVLFHCTAGKDRTGLIAALLLANAGVADENIVADYALTEQMIAPMVEEMLSHSALHGASMEQMRLLLGSTPETMLATIDHITRTYGSAADYLAHAGLDAGTIARLRTRLIGEV